MDEKSGEINGGEPSVDELEEAKIIVDQVR
jgi:hypothetical protein